MRTRRILDACLRNGVWLPHSCTHGTCATCKAEVLDGDVDHGAASTFALMDYERDEGKLLPCVACPRSDVVIEADIDVDESVEVFPVQDYTGTVVELEEIALHTRRLVIELDREIGFNAGQYLKFQVPARDGLPAVDRTWSIASPPTETRRLEFHVRNVPGGRGTDGWVFGGLTPGDTVSVAGPYGRFVLKTDDDRHAILVGGGTGLAPLKSMVRHALENDAYDGRLTLYQGARTREWLYDVAYFRSLADQFPDRFTYRPCLSEETAADCGADATAYGFGMVTDVIAAGPRHTVGLHRLPLRPAADGRGRPEDPDGQAALPPRHPSRGLLQRGRQGDRRRPLAAHQALTGGDAGQRPDSRRTRLRVKAAVRTAGPSVAGSTDPVDPVTDSPARTRRSAPNTGAATQDTPRWDSSRSSAIPTERILRSSRVRLPAVAMVRGVSRGRPASTRARTVAAELYARITFPTPVACAGSRPPVRDVTSTPLVPRIST